MVTTLLPEGYPADLEGEVATSLGTVRIRPIRPTDEAKLTAFHEALSPESQYLRFFNAHPHLSMREVEHSPTSTTAIGWRWSPS